MANRGGASGILRVTRIILHDIQRAVSWRSGISKRIGVTHRVVSAARSAAWRRGGGINVARHRKRKSKA